MGILEFILYMFITFVVGTIVLISIKVSSEEDKLLEEIKRLKEIISKKEYKKSKEFKEEN